MRSLLMTLAICLGLCAAANAADPGSWSVVHGWPDLPEEDCLGQVPGVGVDSEGNVFVFRRADRVWRPGDADDDLGEVLFLSTFRQSEPKGFIQHDAVLKLDRETGSPLGGWGHGQFIMPHGLTVDHEDNIWLTDIVLHQALKFSPGGALLLALGEAGEAGLGPDHFNAPTDVAVAANGDVYVADGYGNSRVAKFDAEGNFLLTWGEPGDGPGQFSNPHAITIDAEGRVYVADRNNARVQIFDAEGGYLTEWKSEALGRPWSVAIGGNGRAYVLDGGDNSRASAPRSRVVELDLDGTILHRWGRYGLQDGAMVLPHDLAVDQQGCVYVGDVHYGMRVQKFCP